jgi:predicted 3-demethylubiquinone-9 3-methyltransferase (glyoxalase superfamily)
LITCEEPLHLGSKSGGKKIWLLNDHREKSLHMQKITPFLWFNDNAEEAMRFYTSIFKNSKITSLSRYGEAGPGKPNSVMTGTFELDGQPFHALNGGPMFSFTPAISFMVDCKTQEEIDDLSAKLSEGGEQQPCGWVKDKFGLSWQIIPTVLAEMLRDKDPVKSKRVMESMLAMKKLEIAKLKKAYQGDSVR